MAKYNSISIGSGRGSLGNVTLARWKDKKVAKQKIDAQPFRKWTDAQISQQEKFALLADWIDRVSLIIPIGFKRFTNKITAYNAAIRANMQAVQGSAHLFSLDWTKVLVADGNFYNVSSAQVEAVEDEHEIKFTWVNDSATLPFVEDGDHVYCVGYNSDRKLMIFSTTTRTAGTLTIDHPAEWAGDSVQCYIFTVSKDGSRNSSSIRISEVTCQ